MFGIVLFGLILGIMASALTRDFRIRHMVGWIIIATFGALEGRFIVSLLDLQNEYVPIFSAALTALGAMALIGVKLLIKPKNLIPQDLA